MDRGGLHREALREAAAADVDAFMRQGGKVQSVPTGATAYDTTGHLRRYKNRRRKRK